MQVKKSSWSPGSIGDEVFRTKFITLPDIISDWVREHVSLADCEILDFGCGEGVTALGLALQHGSSRVVGVDIMSDPDKCLPMAKKELGLASLPANLEFHRVTPGALHDGADRFDIIYSWSVFEHIDPRVINSVVRQLHERLRPDGVVFVQIAPLYYSAEGSHLCDYVGEPWGHLLNPENVYYDKLVASTTADTGLLDSLWSTYTTLNRITASGLLRLL